MNAIWKFELVIADLVTVEMPDGAHPLHVGIQGDYPHGTLCLWAMVETLMPKIPYEFRVVGTGHAAPDLDKYVGTVHHGPFVWHVFEVHPRGLLRAESFVGGLKA